MRKYTAVAIASGASFVVGSFFGTRFQDILPFRAEKEPHVETKNFQKIVANSEEFWTKPSRASEIMKFGN